MIIGVPKEIKNHEYRVGLIPSSVHELTQRGHRVLIESNAGLAIGYTNAHYQQVGAEIVEHADDIFARAEMIVKVKEPQPNECKKIREGQIIFTYLHLAPDPLQTQLLCESGCSAIAYETVTDAHYRLPLLTPMSEVAGRLSIQAGAQCLQKANGGLGVLLGGVPGTSRGHVVILGGGVVGSHALAMAVGLQAEVTLFDISLSRLRELDLLYGQQIQTRYANQNSICEVLEKADLVIGAVLVTGGTAPKIITRDMLSHMQPGAVIVDVAIDQGGCVETSRPTTHAEPTFVEEGILHYCVTNMPGAVPRTAALALNHATLPFTLALAQKGLAALHDDPHLANGLNVHRGEVTHPAVAQALGKPYVPAIESISA